MSSLFGSMLKLWCVCTVCNASLHVLAKVFFSTYWFIVGTLFIICCIPQQYVHYGSVSFSSSYVYGSIFMLLGEKQRGVHA